VDESLPPADLRRIRTHPLSRRASKVALEAFAAPVEGDATLASFLDGLSDLLAVRALRGLSRAVVTARRGGRPVYWAMGAHPIKVGLSPVLIRMLERDRISGLVVNGAVAIHDWEIAAHGATSEEVAPGLADGSFGMADETGRALSDASRQAQAEGRGLGETLGRRMVEEGLPHADASLLAAAHRLGRPVTIHVAIGADTVHTHPSADGASVGAATFTDFRRLVTAVGDLAGGVWINCGSAVLLPEVFLKALAAARNLGHDVRDLTTANLDMIRHYRTEENVLRRPTEGGGRWFDLIGHHEINVPLLAAAIEVEHARGRT
jgi:hypothetical protein